MEKIVEDVLAPFSISFQGNLMALQKRLADHGVTWNEFMPLCTEHIEKQKAEVTGTNINKPEQKEDDEDRQVCPVCGYAMRTDRVNTGKKCTAIGGGYKYLDVCLNDPDECTYTRLY